MTERDALIFDFARTLTDGDPEKEATIRCCEVHGKDGITPQKIREAISAGGIDKASPAIKSCFGIFQQVVENAVISREVAEALVIAKESGYDIYISTNAVSEWVRKALKNNRLYVVKSVFGRNNDLKENHPKIIADKYGGYDTLVFIGDSPHDFLVNIDGARTLKVAVKVDPSREKEFKDVGVDIIEHGPLTVQVMKTILEKVR